jgi:hypothetical protein
MREALRGTEAAGSQLARTVRGVLDLAIVGKTKPSGKERRNATSDERMTVLLAEYASLHQLAAFRLEALDRRVPLGVGTLGAFLAAAAALPLASREALLVAVPLATVWLVRTTLAHARSFEDAITRIGELERSVNLECGASLLSFQSEHPSRDSDVGGRTGSETVRTAMCSSFALLAGSAWTAPQLVVWHPATLIGYWCYLVGLGVLLTATVLRFRAYRWTWAGRR